MWRKCSLLVLIVLFVMAAECGMKKNGEIKKMDMKDKYEFDFRIVSQPAVLEDREKGTIRIAFVKYMKEVKNDKETALYEVMVCDPNGKQHNKEKILFYDPFVIPPGKPMEAVDRNEDGVDELLVYDVFGRGWIFSQDGKKIKGYGDKDEMDRAGILTGLRQEEITIGKEKKKKIIAMMSGTGGRFDNKYFIDIRTPGKDSLSGYPLKLSNERIYHSPAFSIIGENIYMLLDLSPGEIDGYSVKDSKRLPGFPIGLSGISTGSRVDMCAARSNGGLVFCNNENRIYRVDVKSKKIQKIEIPVGKAIVNVKTGYANSEEYIYAFDMNLNNIYKVDAKNKIADTIKTGAPDAYEFKYFNAWSLENGKETYLFFVYNVQSLADVEKMFEKYAPAGEGKKIEDRIYNGHKEYYNTKILNAEQLKEAKDEIKKSKASFLRSHIGREKYHEIMIQTPKSKIIVFKDAKGKIEQLRNDEIEGYVLKTLFADFPDLFPAIYYNNKLGILSFLIPLNSDNDKKNETSIIKTYMFNDIK